MMMVRRLTRVAAIVACLTATAVGVVACGSDDDNTNSDAGAATTGKLTTIKMSVNPQSSFATLKVGIDQGFFKKHGIDLQITTTGEPQTLPPAILSNQIQAGGWTFGSFGVIAEAKLPIVIVAPLDSVGASADADPVRLLALKSS